MSKYFERFERYYQRGIYRAEHLAKLVASGALTAEEYQTLTGSELPGVN